MKLGRPVDSACVATRERISLALDDRISELDRAYLRAHVERCEPCRAYRESVLEATRLLRGDELESPGFSIELPRRRRVPVQALQATAGAAAIALVAVFTSAPGIVGHGVAARTKGSAQQHAFVVRNGKFVPAGNGQAGQRLTPNRIAL